MVQWRVNLGFQVLKIKSRPLEFIGVISLISSLARSFGINAGISVRMCKRYGVNNDRIVYEEKT